MSHAHDIDIRINFLTIMEKNMKSRDYICNCNTLKLSLNNLASA